MEEQSFKENHEDLKDKIQEINRKLKLDSNERKKNFPRKKVTFKEQIDIRKGINYVLGFLSFVGICLGAILIGGLIRGEDEFSLFEELKISENFLQSVLIVIMYLSLLVCLFVFSFYFLYLIYYLKLRGNEDSELWDKSKKEIKTKSIWFSTWFVFFFFLFHKSIFLFINNIPDDIWNGWLILIFLIYTVTVGIIIFKKDV